MPVTGAERTARYILAKKYLDLHIHSAASDGLDAPQQVARGAAASGLDGVALTDHDTFAGIPEFMAEMQLINIEREYQGNEPVFAIPGIETTAQEGHVIGLFPDRSGKDSLFEKRPYDRRPPLMQVIRHYLDQGGLIILPHPGAWYINSISIPLLHEIAKTFPAQPIAIELNNWMAQILPGREDAENNLMGMDLNFARTANTDAHRAQDIGRSRTVLNAKKLTAQVLRDRFIQRRTDAVPNWSNPLDKFRILAVALRADLGSRLKRRNGSPVEIPR